jgi:hypothetical protein
MSFSEFRFFRQSKTALVFLASLFVGLSTILFYLWTTTYTYVVKANAQYLEFRTVDQQMQWSIQGFSLCEEPSYDETDLFEDSLASSRCSFELSDVETQKTSKFEISDNVNVTISWVEGVGLIANLYNPERVGTLRFFSNPNELDQAPKLLKGNVRLILSNHAKSQELLLYGTHFAVGQLPTVGVLSSLIEGVLEVYGAREFLQSYRYLISTETLSQGSAVRLVSSVSSSAKQTGLYAQGFLRVARQSSESDHFYIRLSPPYKYGGLVQEVLVEIAEFGGENKSYRPNLFEVIQRDNHLAIIITFFAIFLALSTLARAMMDLRELFTDTKAEISSDEKK